jgi:type VI secretion system secreted protein Hcp
MAVDMFLKIDGIKGESMDEKHKGEIEILSYSFGAQQQGTSGTGGGGGAGKVSFSDFHFQQNMHTGTTDMLLAMCTGKHIPKALLTQRKAGGKQETFLKVTFEDVLVTSWQPAAHGSSSELPQESITLNFSSMKVEYAPQNKDGTVGAFSNAGWSVKTNAKV